MDLTETEKSLKMVTAYGLALEFVQNQTPEICRAALEQNPEAVIYVKDKALAEKLREELHIELKSIDATKKLQEETEQTMDEMMSSEEYLNKLFAEAEYEEQQLLKLAEQDRTEELNEQFIENVKCLKDTPQEIKETIIAAKTINNEIYKNGYEAKVIMDEEVSKGITAYREPSDASQEYKEAVTALGKLRNTLREIFLNYKEWKQEKCLKMLGPHHLNVKKRNAIRAKNCTDRANELKNEIEKKYRETHLKASLKFLDKKYAHECFWNKPYKKKEEDFLPRHVKKTEERAKHKIERLTDRARYYKDISTVADSTYNRLLSQLETTKYDKEQEAIRQIELAKEHTKEVTQEKEKYEQKPSCEFAAQILSSENQPEPQQKRMEYPYERVEAVVRRIDASLSLGDTFKDSNRLYPFSAKRDYLTQRVSYSKWNEETRNYDTYSREDFIEELRKRPDVMQKMEGRNKTKNEQDTGSREER